MIPRIHIGGCPGPSLDYLGAPRLVTRRRGGSRRVAVWLAAAFLLSILIAVAA